MLWLVGMMGSGKSTVARRIGDHLGVVLVDMDEELERRWGPIERQWRDEGEATFRRREEAMVERLARSPGDVVVATGGGVVLSADSVDTMRASGTVVWLRTSRQTLESRLQRSALRPILRSSSLETIHDQRADLYSSAAHAIVDTDEKTVEQVVEEVESIWHR
jgi:shikimate kinase